MQEISRVEIFAIMVLDCIRRRYGFNLQECLINWAICEIQRGTESTELNVLSAMSIFDSPFEVEEYFIKAMHSLNLVFPTKSEAIHLYITFLCNKLLINELSESECCKIISEICSELDYQGEYLMWFKLREDRCNDIISETDFRLKVRQYAQNFIACSK